MSRRFGRPKPSADHRRTPFERIDAAFGWRDAVAGIGPGAQAGRAADASAVAIWACASRGHPQHQQPLVGGAVVRSGARRRELVRRHAPRGVVRLTGGAEAVLGGTGVPRQRAQNSVYVRDDILIVAKNTYIEPLSLKSLQGGGATATVLPARRASAAPREHGTTPLNARSAHAIPRFFASMRGVAREVLLLLSLSTPWAAARKYPSGDQFWLRAGRSLKSLYFTFLAILNFGLGLRPASLST